MKLEPTHHGIYAAGVGSCALRPAEAMRTGIPPLRDMD